MFNWKILLFFFYTIYLQPVFRCDIVQICFLCMSEAFKREIQVKKSSTVDFNVNLSTI